jgi:hypothetical protein
MPDGSSSAAPVMMPGPERTKKAFNQTRLTVTLLAALLAYVSALKVGMSILD